MPSSRSTRRAAVLVATPVALSSLLLSACGSGGDATGSSADGRIDGEITFQTRNLRAKFKGYFTDLIEKFESQHPALGADRVNFLGDQWLLLFSAMALTVWKGLGYYMIIHLAALANVPRELHEAAAVDGAGPVRRFVSVTIPSVRSTMVLVGALSSVAAFKVFSEVYLLAGPTGGPAGADTTLVMLVQRVGTGLGGRVGYASAISLVIFVVALVLMLLVLRADRKEDAL